MPVAANDDTFINFVQNVSLVRPQPFSCGRKIGVGETEENGSQCFFKNMFRGFCSNAKKQNSHVSSPKKHYSELPVLEIRKQNDHIRSFSPIVPGGTPI